MYLLFHQVQTWDYLAVRYSLVPNSVVVVVVVVVAAAAHTGSCLVDLTKEKRKPVGYMDDFK